MQDVYMYLQISESVSSYFHHQLFPSRYFWDNLTTHLTRTLTRRNYLINRSMHRLIIKRKRHTSDYFHNDTEVTKINQPHFRLRLHVVVQLYLFFSLSALSNHSLCWNCCTMLIFTVSFLKKFASFSRYTIWSVSNLSSHGGRLMSYNCA